MSETRVARVGAGRVRRGVGEAREGEEGEHEARAAQIVREAAGQRPEPRRGVARDVPEVFRGEQRQVPRDRRRAGPEERGKKRIFRQRRRREGQRVARLAVHEGVEGRVDAAEPEAAAQRRAPADAARRQKVVRIPTRRRSQFHGDGGARRTPAAMRRRTFRGDGSRDGSVFRRGRRYKNALAHAAANAVAYLRTV